MTCRPRVRGPSAIAEASNAKVCSWRLAEEAGRVVERETGPPWRFVHGEATFGSGRQRDRDLDDRGEIDIMRAAEAVFRRDRGLGRGCAIGADRDVRGDEWQLIQAAQRRIEHVKRSPRQEDQHDGSADAIEGT